MTSSLTKFRVRFLLAVVITAVILVFPTPAHAGTYYDSYSGNGYSKTNTLNYLATHKPFNLRIWVSGSIGSKQYTIKMYNKSGGQVWSAKDQGDRTYYIGNNVTKLVIDRNNLGTTTRTNWLKK